MCVGFRAILLPFSIKATKQGQKMQEIQPELNKLVERARLSQSMGMASDAANVREEMMEIYRKAGVSPMGPMVGSLIQLPVVLSCFMGSYQNYHVKVGDTLVKLTDPNPKNKRIYKVGERCHLVFDPESVHVL